MKSRLFLFRILCAALAIVSHARSMAASPSASAPVLYLSKLPLESADKRDTPGDTLSFYCAGNNFASVLDITTPSENVPSQVASCRNDRTFDGKGTKITVVYV